MFGIFWNNKKQNNTSDKNNDGVLSSSPPNNYDIESASYLHQKKAEKKIQIEETNNLNQEQNEIELVDETEEITSEVNSNKSVFPV